MLHCLTSVTEGQSFTGFVTLKLKEGIPEVLPGFANKYFKHLTFMENLNLKILGKNKGVFMPFGLLSQQHSQRDI